MLKLTMENVEFMIMRFMCNKILYVYYCIDLIYVVDWE